MVLVLHKDVLYIMKVNLLTMIFVNNIYKLLWLFNYTQFTYLFFKLMKLQIMLLSHLIERNFCVLEKLYWTEIKT